MEAQWLLLGLALALTVMTVAAFVRPNGLVRGNLAWFACGWIASEFAPWLVAAALVMLVAFTQFSDALAGDPGQLAAMLLAASGGGLLAIAGRARHAPARLEAALAEALGPGYLREVPAQRLPAIADEVPVTAYLHALPRRPRGVERIPDVPYPGGHARNVLDVYRPAGGVRDAPVLLQLHGGGWTRGHKRQQALPLVHHLASLGWIVVTPNYRLAPAARFPAALVDCKSAFAWVRGHVAELGGDPSFVAVTGGGTGAHLATLLALTFDDAELQPGFEHVDTRPAACIPLHGTYDAADRHRRQGNTRARLRWLADTVMPCTLDKDPQVWDRASPCRLVRPDAPPFFVLHGTHDSLAHIADARDFVRALRQVSAQPVAYAEVPGAQHGWDSVCSPRALHTVRAVTRFLEWCAARHRALGSQRDSADRARS
jgi:acetyl esterase/lipase